MAYDNGDLCCFRPNKEVLLYSWVLSSCESRNWLLTRTSRSLLSSSNSQQNPTTDIPGWPLTPIHRNCSGFSSQVVSQQARAGLSGGGCVCLYGGSSSAGCMTAACHSIHATQHHIASPFTACHWRGKSLLCPAACICHGLSHMQRDAQCGEIDCVACPCRLP